MSTLHKPASTVAMLKAFFAPELRAWRGEMALWKVYWLYGVGVSGVLGLLLFAAMRAQRMALQQALLAVLGVYTVWILISVWRCAGRAGPPWGFFARLSTVVWAINAVLVLAFLEADLIARVVSG